MRLAVKPGGNSRKGSWCKRETRAAVGIPTTFMLSYATAVTGGVIESAMIRQQFGHRYRSIGSVGKE